jgi:hypothetical protein
VCHKWKIVQMMFWIKNSEIPSTAGQTKNEYLT